MIRQDEDRRRDGSESYSGPAYFAGFGNTVPISPPAGQRLAGQRSPSRQPGTGSALGIENLNVSGMIRAGLQSKALADAGMSTLLDQIGYKAAWYGTHIVEADQWYSSSRTCSARGEYKAELGRQLHWSCSCCGVIHDRNQNAAHNLRKLALLTVGEDVMLLDGGALASGHGTAGETAPDEGRTKPGTMVHRQLSLAL